ncbi:AT hook domain-containing protein [Paraphaeosphaeria sporulosa]
MDSSRGEFASLQARLDTFAAPKTKARRPSARGKKAARKAAPKGGWPLEFPRPEELAYAGFTFKPTSASPDNVQCFHCQTQLDGWEPNDVPAYEHLTHSPECGFALNLCIRLRDGDPGRNEEDPLSERMIEARRETFQDLWPLDTAAGYPSIEQMVEGGWYFDPSHDQPDGATCPYCSLSLDAWDIGDDPTEEHRKRNDDCLFFTLKEYYHPAQTKKSKAARSKRSSTRSSTASTRTKKTTRTKNAISKDDVNKPLPPAPDETRVSSIIASFPDLANASMMSIAPPAPPRRGRKAKIASTTDETIMSSVTESLAAGAGLSMISIPPKAPPAKRGRKPQSSSILDEAPVQPFAEPSADSIASPDASAPTKAPAKKGRKPKAAAAQVGAAGEPFAESFAGSVASTMSKAPTKARHTRKAPERVSAISTTSTTRTTRGTKRQSEAVEMEIDMEEQMPSAKRTRLSDISLPQFESTPVHTPKEYRQEKMKSPASRFNATPRATRPVQSLKSPGPVSVRSPLAVRSPMRAEPQTPEEPHTPKAVSSPVFKWDPIVISNIVTDAGLEKEDMDIDMADTTENITKAVLASLTSPEKRMTIEEFVLHNAKRGEEKLRLECERQIAAFEAEGRRALAALDAY